MKNQPSRRTFLKQAGVATALLPIAPYLSASPTVQATTASQLQVHLFSKHLQFLNYKEMASAAADIGFQGVELAVRPKGHVEPEKVETQLPQAIEALKSQGLLATQMVTAITDAETPVNRIVLETAAALDIKNYRLGYFSFPKEEPMINGIKAANKDLKKLAKWNKKLGIKGAYQNHAGVRVGASIWEVWQILQGIDPALMGCQFDIRHAVVEGGLSWPNSLRLIKDHIHTIVAKDFKWEKKEGKWTLQNTPLGEGMVDFKTYFATLKKINIQVPVALHLEYPLGGAEHGAKELDKKAQKLVFEAMKKDLTWLQQTWAES
ncbi:MAG: sugar phosphate isomerase/epimerase family protein [Saprospiraceae bacterium]